MGEVAQHASLQVSNLRRQAVEDSLKSILGLDSKSVEMADHETVTADVIEIARQGCGKSNTLLRNADASHIDGLIHECEGHRASAISDGGSCRGKLQQRELA